MIERINYKGITLNDLSDNEVLFFIRIRGSESYFKNVYTKKFLEIFENVNNYKCISEYKKNADVHIDLNSIERDYLYKEEFKEFSLLFNMHEIITRCRGLRSISFNKAKSLIYKAYLFFNTFYKVNINIKLIVMGTIDNYIMDMMVTIGEKYGKKFIGITDSFLSPEYKLCTVRGEFNNVGKCSEETIVIFKEKILNSILNSKPPKLSRIFKNNLYYILSFYYRYIVRYLIKHKIFSRLEYEYVFAPELCMIKSFDQLFAIKYLEYNHDFNLIKEKKAYIPLHFYPEATTDYWIDTIYDVDYLTSVLNTINRLKKLGYTVYIKEHPHYFLSRESSFYKSLLKEKVILLSPFTTTKEVFDNVDLVVVWNGSTGIESMVYGKDTVKVTNSYYGDDNMKNLSDLESNSNINYNVSKCIEKVYRTSFRTI